MSYSFSLRAATKAQVKQMVADKITEVVGQQDCHARDKDQVLAAANAFIDLVADDETKDVGVNMSGSLGGLWEGTDVVAIESAYVSITAYLMTRAVS